jgi:UDP-GlcNAc:undecaprenyl-phosphate GlcNAc-1-phosphate transferase
LLTSVGIVDDYVTLSHRWKFSAQIVAALLMCWGGGLVLYDLGYVLQGGALLQFGWLAVPFTVFATVGVINAVNMSDGLDGLSGSLLLVGFIGMAIAAHAAGAMAEFEILAIICAGLVAFLLFNMRLFRRKQALIFMGDAGTTVLGFAYVWFAVSLSQGATRAISPATAAFLLALPILDTITMMVRRAVHGRSPFKPDREHLHHVFLMAGFTVTETVITMAAGAALGAAMSLTWWFQGWSEGLLLSIFLVSGVGYFWVMLRSWRVMRFLNRSICRRRTMRDRRKFDRRMDIVSAATWSGDERRAGKDRRQAPRRVEDHSGLETSSRPVREADTRYAARVYEEPQHEP